MVALVWIDGWRDAVQLEIVGNGLACVGGSQGSPQSVGAFVVVRLEIIKGR